MSHPENTLKQIIERQDKKIEQLIDIIITMAHTYKIKSSLNEDFVHMIVSDLYELKELK